MTGVIISIPPGVELPPGSATGPGTVLPPVNYIPAIPGFAQTWTAVQTFLPGTFSLNGITSGFTLINASNVASGVWTVQAGTDVFVGRSTTDTLINKTIDGNNNSLLNIPASQITGAFGSFQSVSAASATIANRAAIVAIQRAAPAATALTLPLLASQAGTSSSIVDFSTSVTNHAITITPTGGATIMGQSSWTLYSTADQLGSLTLRPSLDLNSWVIAP